MVLILSGVTVTQRQTRSKNDKAHGLAHGESLTYSLLMESKKNFDVALVIHISVPIVERSYYVRTYLKKYLQK